MQQKYNILINKVSHSMIDSQKKYMYRTRKPKEGADVIKTFRSTSTLKTKRKRSNT